MANVIMTAIGGLTKDVETAQAKNGSMARLSLACHKPYPNQEESMYFNVTTFGANADFCAKNLKKGSQVMVVGEFTISEYQGKDGTTKQSYNITAYNVSFAPAGTARRTDADQVVSRGNKTNYDKKTEDDTNGFPF